MSYLVYLAGPITGCSFGEAVDWREEFAEALPVNIVGMSPMRGKDYLKHLDEIPCDCDEIGILSGPKAVVTRDYNDCTRCDCIVVNLLGAERVSIGTVMEIAWAKAFDVPVVLVMEKEGNIHDHIMIQECCGFRTDNLESARSIVTAILLPVPHRDWIV
jgi:nucleoside 2-deoxyribosyltransferase